MKENTLDFNVIIIKPSIDADRVSKDQELFFGPLTGSETWLMSDSDHMAVILTKLGLFPSNGQARKNGWDKLAPEGFSEFVIGKLKTKVTILNISEKLFLP